MKQKQNGQNFFAIKAHTCMPVLQKRCGKTSATLLHTGMTVGGGGEECYHISIKMERQYFNKEDKCTVLENVVLGGRYLTE